MIDNIEQAVAVLNKHHYENYGSWRTQGNRTFGIADRHIRNEDAIAIASYLELRKTCEPFFKVAERIPSTWPDEMFWEHPEQLYLYTEIFEESPGVPVVRDWRKLAALRGKQS